MNLTSLKNAVTSRAGRQLLLAQKHSPKILFVAGIVGFGATVVLAARATLRVEEVLDEHENLKTKIDSLHIKVAGDAYSDQDRQADLVKLYVRTSLRFGKLYGPAFLCGAVSIAALTGSHVVLNSRYLGVSAALAAAEKSFGEYRRRVTDRFGEDVEREIATPLEYTTVSEKTAEGKNVKKKVPTGVAGHSQYSFIFDERSSSWKREWDYNRIFLQAQQQYANDLLRARGHVFLNDVFDMLGLPRTSTGAVVGWVAGKGDDFVDFGIFRGDTYMGMEFVNGNERSVILEPNVAGEIWRLI